MTCGHSAIWQVGSKVVFSCRAPWRKACPHIQLVLGESCRYSDTSLPFSQAWGEPGSSRQEPCLPWPLEPAMSQVLTLRPETQSETQKPVQCLSSSKHYRNILLNWLPFSHQSSVHKQGENNTRVIPALNLVEHGLMPSAQSCKEM